LRRTIELSRIEKRHAPVTGTALDGLGVTRDKVVALLAPMQRDVVKDHIVPLDTTPAPAGK
jgi:hypothetical protein